MPKELQLPADVVASPTAVEIFRAWTVDGGLTVAFQNAFESPGTWGLLLMDIARHVARGYADEGEYTEDQAMEEILTMFLAELRRPTDLGTTERSGDN